MTSRGHGSRSTGSPAWLGRAGVAIARHPLLWPTALRQALVLAPAGWWRRAPHLPLPDAAYLRFRMVTQYGDPDHEPEPEDLLTYLHWCRAERRGAR